MQVVNVLIFVNEYFVKPLGKFFGKRGFCRVAVLVKIYKELQRKVAYIGEIVTVCASLFFIENLFVTLYGSDKLFGNGAQISGIGFVFTLGRAEKRNKLFELSRDDFFLRLDRFRLERGVVRR